MTANNSPEKLHQEDSDVLTTEEKLRDLILFNDDHNTFEHVIKSLIDVCEHDTVQAELCTLIIHYNGKCVVKTGEYSRLDPMRNALIDRGLSAIIS